MAPLAVNSSTRPGRIEIVDGLEDADEELLEDIGSAAQRPAP
jgi:hypothetical protein